MYREFKTLYEEISKIEQIYYNMIKCNNSEDLQELVCVSTLSTVDALKSINRIVRKMDEQYHNDINFNR